MVVSGTIAFLFGVLTLQQFHSLPSWPWLLLNIPLVLLLLRPRWRLWVGPLVAFAIGISWSALYAHWYLTDQFDLQLEGQDLLVQGVILSLPQLERQRARFEFKPYQASLDGQPVELRAGLRLNWYGSYPADLAPGQHWQLLVRLKRPWGMMNPGGFDYEAWLFQQGLGATGYVRTSADNQLLTDHSSSQPLQRLRHRLQLRLQTVLADHPAQGIISALSIGERGDMDDSQWAVLLSTGTNHLMAISGLHVGMVAGLLFFLMRLAWSYCPRCCLWLAAPRAAAIAGMLAGLGYAALAGFSIPTQRAVIMLAVVLGAVFLQRPLAAGRALAVALWLVLLWQPVAVLAAGFWLSFAAVALILYGMQGRQHTGGLWWKWGRVQWLVSLGLLPLLILFFGRGSLSSPLANLIAVPWVSMVVVPLTLLGTSMLWWWEAGGAWILLWAADTFQWLWPILQWLDSAVPVLRLPASGWPLMLAALGIAWLLLPRGWPLRPLGLILCLPVLFWRPAVPAVGEAWFTLLDVGQGQAAVIQTHQHTLIMDTGPRFPSGFNTGDAVLLPYLQTRGINRVDKLVISHSDNDHLGGARALVDGVEVLEVLSGESRNMDWLPHSPCQRGDEWEWDGVVFRFLHPERAMAERSGNDDACVLQIRAGAHVLLIASDIEAYGERQLLSNGEPLRADVLVAPHHGSLTSSTPPFVETVAPAWVLYSAGYRNRHGHPRDEVMARYRSIGATERITWQEGAIQVYLGGENMPQIQGYREQQKRYWHSSHANSP